MSTESSVVGFVEAVCEATVRGSEPYPECVVCVRCVVFEGEGEGGDVGGNGRIDASSSASGCIEGDHIDPGANEGDKDRERTLVPSLTLVSCSPSASPAVVPLRLFLLFEGPTERECEGPR